MRIWWRHYIFTRKILPCFWRVCADNASVTGGFPRSGPVMRIFKMCFCNHSEPKSSTNNRVSHDLRRLYSRITTLTRTRCTGRMGAINGSNGTCCDISDIYRKCTSVIKQIYLIELMHSIFSNIRRTSRNMSKASKIHLDSSRFMYVGISNEST